MRKEFRKVRALRVLVKRCKPQKMVIWSRTAAEEIQRIVGSLMQLEVAANNLWMDWVEV